MRLLAVFVGIVCALAISMAIWGTKPDECAGWIELCARTRPYEECAHDAPMIRACKETR